MNGHDFSYSLNTKLWAAEARRKRPNHDSGATVLLGETWHIAFYYLAWNYKTKINAH